MVYAPNIQKELTSRFIQKAVEESIGEDEDNKCVCLLIEFLKARLETSSGI